MDSLTQAGETLGATWDHAQRTSVGGRGAPGAGRAPSGCLSLRLSPSAPRPLPRRSPSLVTWVGLPGKTDSTVARSSEPPLQKSEGGRTGWGETLAHGALRARPQPAHCLPPTQGLCFCDPILASGGCEDDGWQLHLQGGGGGRAWGCLA